METRPKVVAKTTMFASKMIKRSKIKLSNIKSVTVTVWTVTLKIVKLTVKIIYMIFHNKEGCDHFKISALESLKMSFLVPQNTPDPLHC